jgi:hypothetical protein
MIRIHQTFSQLNLALGTAVTKDDQGTLDKDATSENDTLDAFRLSLLNVRFRKQNDSYNNGSSSSNQLQQQQLRENALQKQR